MPVVSPTLTGLTAMPNPGTPRCGYMRPTKHHCKDLSCPLNEAQVMVFAPAFWSAVVSCRRLWDTAGKSIVLQKFRVNEHTFHITDDAMEHGLLEGDPKAWGDFRTLIGEHGLALLTSVNALVVSADAPTDIWEPIGRMGQLPRDPELASRTGEDPSWQGSGLGPAGVTLEDFLKEVDDEDEDSREGDSL